MSEKKQEWALVCVRHPGQFDSAAEQCDSLGCVGGDIYQMRDVHPLDVDKSLENLDDDIIITMSVPIINAFAAYSAKDARKRLRFVGEDGKLRQMSTEQADAFYRAWNAGVQHVSEILISQGLWQ